MVSFHPAHSRRWLSCDLNIKAEFVAGHHGDGVLAASAAGVQVDLGRIFGRTEVRGQLMRHFVSVSRCVSTQQLSEVLPASFQVFNQPKTFKLFQYLYLSKLVLPLLEPVLIFTLYTS